MAGDWIKMRTNLDTDPRVVEIAAQLNMTELHVIGCLWKLWAWANDHSIDGNAIRVTHVTLDRYTSVPGFAEALRNVGWLEGRDTALTFPRFAEHNGQTAKKRAETKERVSKFRNAKSVTPVTQNALPEKRREEKRREEVNTDNTTREDFEHQPPPVLVTFPDVLDVPTFRTAWTDEWIPYLRKRDSNGREPPLQSQLAQLAKLAVHGPTIGIQAIQESIRQTWTGLFPEKLANDNGYRKNPRSNAVRSRERSL